jgi:hypothetical protein
MSQSDQSGAPTVCAALPQNASHSTAAAPPAADQNSGSDEDAALALAYTVDRDCPHVTQSNIDRSVLQLDGDTLKDEQLLLVSNVQSVAIFPAKRTGAAEGDIVNPKRQRITKSTERVLNANELNELQKLISSALTVTFELKCCTVTLQIDFISSAGGSSRNSAFNFWEKNQNIEECWFQNTIFRVRHYLRFHCIRLQIVQNNFQHLT